LEPFATVRPGGCVVLHDLDKTIQEMLRKELPQSISSAVTFTFVPPDDKFPPNTIQLPAIDIFLFAVVENRELRSSEPILERQGDGTIRKSAAPARVDCHYIITASAPPSAPNPQEDEHRILGETMRVLLRHRQIPADFLQGSLQGQDPPVRAAAIVPGAPGSGMDLWQALKVTPHASLHYSLTISVDTGALAETIPTVANLAVIGAA
jgi:hypothetical protein